MPFYVRGYPTRNEIAQKNPMVPVFRYLVDRLPDKASLPDSKMVPVKLHLPYASHDTEVRFEDYYGDVYAHLIDRTPMTISYQRSESEDDKTRQMITRKVQKCVESLHKTEMTENAVIELDFVETVFVRYNADGSINNQNRNRKFTAVEVETLINSNDPKLDSYQLRMCLPHGEQALLDILKGLGATVKQRTDVSGKVICECFYKAFLTHEKSFGGLLNLDPKSLAFTSWEACRSVTQIHLLSNPNSQPAKGDPKEREDGETAAVKDEKNEEVDVRVEVKEEEGGNEVEEKEVKEVKERAEEKVEKEEEVEEKLERGEEMDEEEDEEDKEEVEEMEEKEKEKEEEGERIGEKEEREESDREKKEEVDGAIGEKEEMKEKEGENREEKKENVGKKKERMKKNQPFRPCNLRLKAVVRVEKKKSELLDTDSVISPKCPTELTTANFGDLLHRQRGTNEFWAKSNSCIRTVTESFNKVKYEMEIKGIKFFLNFADGRKYRIDRHTGKAVLTQKFVRCPKLKFVLPSKDSSDISNFIEMITQITEEFLNALSHRDRLLPKVWHTNVVDNYFNPVCSATLQSVRRRIEKANDLEGILGVPSGSPKGILLKKIKKLLTAWENGSIILPEQLYKKIKVAAQRKGISIHYRENDYSVW